MAEETQYTADTGMVSISTANSKLDGTGTLTTLLTGASKGTLVKSIFIKSLGTTLIGMIRIFVENSGGSKFLLVEVPVEGNRNTGTQPAFQTQLELNMTLESGYKLFVGTQNANTFDIIAEGLYWNYYATSVRPDTTQLTANNGVAKVFTANANLDGTGTVVTGYTAGASTTYKGSSIRTITLKSIVNVTSGMIRIFIEDTGGARFLLTEVNVDTDTKSALDEAYERTVLFDDDLDIEAGFKLVYATEVGESFSITTEGTDWNYAS